MGTLSSELASLAEQVAEAPRVYVDANVPAGLVRFMRESLGWDVLFVMEDDELRRAPDIQHFRLAVRLRRTLITLDRDYLDDALFPLDESGGVLVLTAPHEEQLGRLLAQADRVLFQKTPGMPLLGRKLHVHTDWAGDEEPS